MGLKPLLLALLASLGVGYRGITQLAKSDYRAMAEDSSTAAQQTMAVQLRKVATLASMLGRRGDVATAVAEGDQPQLEQLLTNEFKALHERDETIRTLEITDAKGVVVMRGHNPAKKGDVKANHPMVKEALAGEANTGLTVSPATLDVAQHSVVPLSARFSAPQT